jgi:hypothetical protein
MKLLAFTLTPILMLGTLTACGGNTVVAATAAAMEPGGGGTPSISGLSRDAASIKGGAPVSLNGRNFAANAAVTFGGTAATCTGSGQRLDCTAPPHPTGTVDIVVTNPGGGRAMWSQKFEYLPAPSRSANTSNGYFVYEDFANFPDITACGPKQSAGNPGFQPATQKWVVDTPVTACTGVSIDTTFGHSGTRSLKTTSAQPGYLLYGSKDNGSSFATAGAREPNGLYQRWYFYISQGDINAALAEFASHPTSGQWKLVIARYQGPGFMFLIGPEACGGPSATLMMENSGDTNDVYVSKPTNFCDNFWGGPTLTGNTWHEAQIWEQRSSSWTDARCKGVSPGGVYGKAKIWLDGKLILNVTLGCKIALNGSADTIQGMQYGSYSQNMIKQFTQWFDDIVWANGFVDP